MINNISKKIFKSIFLILTIIINIEPCLAVVITTNNTSSNNNNNDLMQTGTGTYRDENKKINYTYKYSIGLNKIITINVYNMNGDSIILEDIKVDKGIYTFKAGTWIGINVTETQTATWKIDLTSFQYKEEQKIYQCNYKGTCPAKCSCTIGTGENDYCKKLNSCRDMNAGEICYYNCGGWTTTGTNTITYEFYGNPACESTKEVDCGNGNTAILNLTTPTTEKDPITSGDGTNKKTYYEIKDDGYTTNEVTSGNYENSSGAKEIKKQVIERIRATAKAMLGESTSKIRYIKVNDYDVYEDECKNNDSKLDMCYGTVESISKKGIETGPSTEDSGSYYIDYEFLQQKVCINAKTSEVTYGLECNEDEIKIENAEVYDEYLGKDITYWHYFIPLNTKTDSDFWLEVIKNNKNVFSKEECMSVINDKPDSYEYYITPLEENKTFIGDYDEVVDKSRSDDIKILNNINNGEAACSLSARINIPVSQEFYNETTNKDGEKKFKGFNFYYKPIDINNPFPNGLSDTSIWKEWYDNVKDDKKATPNISKSFNEVTYIATNINAAKVRNYTKNNPYTSWKNISLGGRSSFIENENIVMRNEDVSFYKLGCGPYNSDWSECKQ